MQGFSLLVLKLIVSETKTLTTALPSLTHLTRVSQSTRCFSAHISSISRKYCHLVDLCVFL